MYELQWTVDARDALQELPDQLREHADHIVDQITDNPLHKETHPILGNANVRQLVTPGRLYIAYTVIGSMLIILELKMFTTFLVD